jgi:hypothetical protein
MPRRLLAAGCTLAVSCAVAFGAAGGSGSYAPAERNPDHARVVALAHQLRVERGRFRSEMARLRRLLRQARTSPVYYRSPRQWAWECIHRYEGAWNDPNPPYFGGLQMDMNFQRAYGPEFLRRYGTADRWPPGAQMLAADRAWRVRGFSPWPATARLCGLL